MESDDGIASERLAAGRYRLDEVLGRGGMGVVWRATDTLLERTVAIKELRAPQAATEHERATFLDRALREARNAGRLNHPSVVGVHDVIASTDADAPVYIVMEHIAAPSLAKLIEEQGTLPPGRAAVIGIGVLDALDAAHAIGIVHRDVKPGNILVLPGDRVKLTDFGIAHAAEDSRLTSTGIVGTEAYLAPECFESGTAGPAADLWALGATLFHAVAGRTPFDRETNTATMRAIVFDDVPPLQGDPRLAEAVAGLLNRSIEQRTDSARLRQLLRPIAAQPDAPPAAAEHQASREQWERDATGLYRGALPGPTAPGAVRTGTGTGAWGPPTQSGSLGGGPQPTRDPAGAAFSLQKPAGPPTGAPSGPQSSGPGGPLSGPQFSGRPGGPPAGFGQGPPPGRQGPPPGPFQGAPGPGGPFGGPPPRRNNPLPWIIGGGLVAVLAVVLVLVFTVFKGDDSDDSGGGDARGTAEAFFKAAQSRDLDGVRSRLCQRDLSGGIVRNLSRLYLDSYDINSVKESGDRATVNVGVTVDGRTSIDDVIEVRESGDWKVCLSESRLGDDDSGGSSFSNRQPTLSSPAGSSSGPSGPSGATGSNPACPAYETDEADVARVYVSLAGLREIQEAQACTNGSVPEATTQRIADADDSGLSGSSSAGSPYVFRGDSVTVTVTVAEVSDGTYRVTAVSVS